MNPEKRCYLISKEPSNPTAFYGSLGKNGGRSFQAMFMSDLAADTAALFEAIDTLPLTCSFVVTQFENDNAIDTGRYQRNSGQVSPLEEPAPGPLTHLMQEISYSLNIENPYKALQRRWLRHINNLRQTIESQINEAGMALDIMNNPSFLAASSLDAAYWTQKAQENYKHVLYTQGVLLAYQQAIKALKDKAPLKALEFRCEFAKQQDSQGFYAGYSTLYEEIQERLDG